MQMSNTSTDELTRLSFLRSLNLIDTPIEESFERITRLLCRVMNMPIAGISLVDDKRQWFKSIQGIVLQEMPREGSFCELTILQADLLIIRDAAEDERFRDSSCVVNDPGIRFYAGFPLSIGDAINLGAVFVCDNKPRELSEDDIQFQKDIAETVSSEIKSRFLKNVYNLPD